MSVKAPAWIFLVLSLLLGTTTHPFCSGLTQMRQVRREEVDTKGEGFTPLVFTDDSSACPANQKLVPDDGENEFGFSLDVDGDFLVVGEWRRNVDDIEFAGKAYVYRRDEAGRWAQPYTLVHESPSNYDYFGYCVAVSGNRALVGAPSDRAIHVFVRVDDTSNTWAHETVLTAPDDALMFVGELCALHGNTAVVGAPMTDNHKGSAYIFERDETSGWSGPQELKTNDAREDDDWFGEDVAVHGDRAIVGVQGDDGYTGSAYIFVRDASGSWMEEAKLTAGVGREGDYFGTTVAIQENVAIVGAPFTSEGGTMHLFVNGQNGWEEEGNVTGHDVGGPLSVAIDGDNIVIGAGWNNTAHLLSIDDDHELRLVTQLVSEEVASNSGFGFPVGISGTTIAVGAVFDKNDNGAKTGAVHTFESCGI